MIAEVDSDGSGVIEFDEFVHMIVLRMERAMMSDKAQVCGTCAVEAGVQHSVMCVSNCQGEKGVRCV